MATGESVSAPPAAPLHHPCESGHKPDVVGYWRGPRPDGLDCERPLHVRCRRCGFSYQWRCSGHRESRCKPCALRYRRRVRVVVDSGLLRRQGGSLYFLTLTAPGARRHCMLGNGCEYKRAGQDCRHADACRCTPAGGTDLGYWNMGHSAAWNRLRTRISKLHPELEYFRGIEVQDGKRGGTRRGALHDHMLLWVATPLDQSTLREWAMDAGFGHSLDLVPVVPGSKREAYYVAKYVTKSCDMRSDAVWYEIDTATGEISQGRGRYRTWSDSQGWGDSMATVRSVAAAYARTLPNVESDAVALLGREMGAEPLYTGTSPPSPS